VNALMVMGFPRVRCERALKATNNSGPEVAMSWIFEHMDDPDIDKPIPKPSTSNESFSPEAVSQLSDMGFTPAQAKKALRETSGNMERAVEWLFSHADEMPEEPEVLQKKESPMELDMTSPSYKLVGFLVHLGTSVHSGHYVAYLHKNDQWVLFNDRKVAQSTNPPIGQGYMYFFTRNQ